MKKPDLVGGKRKKKKPAWFLPVLAIGSVCFMGLLAAALSRLGGGTAQSEPIKQTTSTTNNDNNAISNAGSKKPNETEQLRIDPIEEFYSVLADDGKSLWAPPAVGSAYSIELLPPGLELLSVFSSDLWTGKQTGPVQDWLLESLPKWTSLVSSYPSVDKDQVRRVTVAAYPGASPGTSEMVLKMELKSPIAIKAFLERHSSFRDQKIPGVESDLYYWIDGNLAVVFDGFTKDIERQITTVTIGPIRILNTFSETAGGIAPVSRQLENLLAVSNSELDLFILTTPSYLYGNGREIYSSVPRFKDLFRMVVDDTIQAVSVSISVRESLYVEGRMIAGDIAKSGSVLSKIRETIDGLADKLETQFASNPVAPYWRLIASRYPQMIRSVSKNTRMGIEDGQLIFNLYQPRESVDNLSIGTWMAIQDVGPGFNQTAVAGVGKPETPKFSTDELLNRPMTLSFAQESLEMSLAAIATEFNDSLPEGTPRIEMMINGGAFQKEGITQNQQIRDFSFDKTPLRELLTTLVRRANPVTTVQSAKEKDQKVVWVVLESPNSPGGKKIELTTRTWAEANGAQLPPEFLP